MSNNSFSNNNSDSKNEITNMFLTANSVKQFKTGDVVVVSKTKYAGLKDDGIFPALKGLNVECATNLSTNVLTDAQLRGLQARHIVESLPVYFGTKTIRVSDCEYAFDFDELRVAYSTKFNNSTREWELDWRQVRAFSVLQFVVNNQVVIEEYVDSRVIMTLLMEQLKGCVAAWQTEGVLSLIKDRLFIQTKGYGHVNVTTDLFGNKVNIHTPEYHWELSKVNVFGIESINETLSFCKGKVTKNTFSIINNSVNDNVPVISDKQATKYFVIGAGAEAMGVYKVDDQLVSFNPLGNTNKGANRIAAGNSKGAQFSDASFSNLVNVLSNGERTATHGKVMSTVVALGLACVAQGEMITNGNNGQDFTFSINKNIRVEVNTSTLGIKVGATYKEVLEALVDIRSGLIESGQVNRVLAPGEEIQVAGTVIYRNNKQVYITLDGDVDVRVGRCGFGGKPSTVRFVINGVAHMAGKKNIKARGESVKATSVVATRETFQIDNNGVADNEWEVLLHSESFKTVHKLIAMFANELALKGKTVEYANDVFSVNGSNSVEITQYDFNAWIVSKLETRVIRRLVCNEDLAEMKDSLLNTKPQSVEINGESVELSGRVHLVDGAEGFTWVEQEVKVIVGFSHFQVEVCTADEWYGKSKAGVIEQYIFGTFHDKLARAFAHKAERGGNSLKYIATSGDKHKVLSAEELMVVNLDNVEERTKFLSKVVSACKAMKATNSGVKGMLQSLNSDIKQEGYHAIRLEFSMNNNVWCADIPVMGMLKFGNFDEQGNPSNDFLEAAGEPDAEGESAVEDAVSVVQNFTNLLSIIKTFKGDSLTKNVFVHYQAHLRNWLARVQTSKIASRLIKGEEMTHLKVVPSFTLGWTKHLYQDGTSASVPNLGFASDSPIWNDINVGDIVISTRMPFPTAVAFRAVVDESIDRTMVSVSPILMSKGNRGDFDGDSLYVMSPRKVSGVTGIKLAEEFNNSLWSLGGFDKSVEGGASNPVVKTITDTFNGAELAEKFFTISSSKSSVQWGADLVNVHKVYSQFVGMSYGWAFDATVKLFESGKADDAKAVLSVLNRWISYEEDTLGGYSERGYEAVVNFKEKVDECGENETAPARASEGAPSTSGAGAASSRNGAWAKMLAAKGLAQVSDNNEFAVRCAAGLNKAKDVERGERHPSSADELSIAALAIRRLTSKTQFRSIGGDSNFFAVAHEYGAKNSRSIAIANLASTTPIKWTK